MSVGPHHEPDVRGAGAELPTLDVHILEGIGLALSHVMENLSTVMRWWVGR